jgi:hypothetical protein
VARFHDSSSRGPRLVEGAAFPQQRSGYLEVVVERRVAFYQRVQAIAPPGVAPPVVSTDAVHFDLIPFAGERAALLAYLRRL